MKRGGILNPQLARAVAEMGHYDMMLVVCAAYPIPTAAREAGKVIDLAVGPDLPSSYDVLALIRQEMWVERIVLNEGAVGHNKPFASRIEGLFPDAETGTETNDWFHEQGSGAAKVIVRTGAWTPFGNVGLVAGIAFVEWVDIAGGEVPEEWQERYERQRRVLG